jgi:curved DNA-binding protein CbpA
MREARVNAYEVLGVAEDATDRHIRFAFRRLSLVLHPDRPGGDAERFKLAASAHGTLTDPGRRAAHDAQLRQVRRAQAIAAAPVDRFARFIRLALAIVGSVEMVQRTRRERAREDEQSLRKRCRRDER